MAHFPAEIASTARRPVICLSVSLALVGSLACGNLAAQPAKAPMVPQSEPLQISLSGPKEAVVDRPIELQVHVFNSGDKASDAGGSLSAVAYKSVGREEKGQLLVWPSAIQIGQLLPTLPLWLGADLAVPQDLEASHAAVCVDLRIRQAS